MLIQMAISRQRLFKIAKTLKLTVKSLQRQLRRNLTFAS
jgi:hypothetical protein